MEVVLNLIRGRGEVGGDCPKLLEGLNVVEIVREVVKIMRKVLGGCTGGGGGLNKGGRALFSVCWRH